MKTNQKTTRRHFIRAAAGLAASGAAAGFRLPAESPQRQRNSTAERIGFATIGVGQQGVSNARAALQHAGVELVGIADLYSGRRRRASELFGERIVRTNDYRELLALDAVDAVIVATSDHWHTAICIEAMEAGKDVYCEKPMVHSLAEGPQLTAAQDRTGRILQVGSQRTSSPVYMKARNMLKAGLIGEPVLVQAWYRRSSHNGAWRYVIPPDASPATVDWERFLGPAPARPFDALRFFRWRNYWDYGTGIPGDLFVHLLTGVHYVCDSLGPSSVAAQGGLRLWKDDREVPDLMLGLYQYPKTENHPEFNVSLSVNFADTVDESGMRIVGSEGVMTVGRGLTLTQRPRNSDIRPSISTFPEEMQQELLSRHPQIAASESVIETESTSSYGSTSTLGSTASHMGTFIDAVRTRQPVLQDAAFGFRAAGPALLANTSYLEGRVVGWDPVSMKQIEG